VNAPQPCGHCGEPVAAGPGRVPGLTWWHRDRPACVAGYRQRRRRTSAQPCGHCGRPVNPGRGRGVGKTWWHTNDECRTGRNRALNNACYARAADRRDAARQRGDS